MPPVIPLVGALAGAEVSSLIVGAGGSLLLGSLAGFVVSTGFSAIGAALTPKPKAQPFTQTAQGQSAMIRSSVESHKIVYGQARVSGPIVFVKTTDSGMNSAGSSVSGANRFLHLVIPLAGHEVDSMPTIYLNDTALTLDANGFASSTPYLKSGLSYIRVKKHLGLGDQIADTNLIAECGLTTDFRLQGIAYVYVRMEWNADVFPTGIPNVSVVVKGKPVYDPRTNTTAWSANAALCIRDYLANDYGFDCTDDEINDDYFIAAANTCDESVSLSTGGSQSRYTCNGVVDTATGPLDNLNSLISSLVGAVTYVQGKFRLHAGVYETPVGDITIDVLAGPVKVRVRTPRNELFNAVQGTYVDPNKNWQPTNFPPITNSTYEADDGGQRILKDIELPFTNHPEAAQRLAKITLEKSRQGIIVEMPVNHAGLRFSAFDVVTLTNDQLGWDAKPMRILKWSTAAGGPIVLTLQEEASASYDWNNGEATTIDTAPDTNLPDPFTVAVPSAVAFSSRAITTTGGDTVYNLSLSWMQHPDQFVYESGTFEIQYKKSSDTDWRSAPPVRGDQTQADILPTSVNVSYDLRIRARNYLGVRSDWVTIIGAIAGSSGGVGTTNDWGNWTDSVGPTNDWGNWTDAIGTTNDWGFFV